MYCYPTAGHIITGNLKLFLILGYEILFLKDRNTDFLLILISIKCREEIAAALNKFGNRWCKREYVDHKALKEWKLSILKLVNKRISFYSQNTNLLPPKPKKTLRHLKLGIKEFHKKYVFAP